MGKRLDSLRRIQIEEGISDDDIQEADKQIYLTRLKRFSKTLDKKYGKALCQRAIDWAKDTLSPDEIKKFSSNPEKLILEYMVQNPGECSSEELSRPLGKDKFKKLLHSPIEDEVDPSPSRWDVEGDSWVEKPVEKTGRKNPQSPTMPSSQKLAGMKSDELGKLIREARAAGVGEDS